MKKLFTTLFAAFILSTATVSAVTTISTDITTGGTVTSSSVSTSTLPRISASGLSSTWICLTNNTCRNTWPASTAGSDGQLQFNSSGSFGASSNLSFDGQYLNLGPGIGLKVGGLTMVDTSGNLFAKVIPLQDTATNLANVVPASGEGIYETDTKYYKIGDGASTASNISPLNALGVYSDGGYYLASTTEGLAIGTTTTKVPDSGSASLMVRNHNINNPIMIGYSAAGDGVFLVNNYGSIITGGQLFVGVNSDGGIISDESKSLNIGALQTIRIGDLESNFDAFAFAVDPELSTIKFGQMSASTLAIDSPVFSVDSSGSIHGKSISIENAHTPSSHTESCTAGQIVWDANYIYVCIATNSWKRSALTTW